MNRGLPQLLICGLLLPALTLLPAAAAPAAVSSPAAAVVPLLRGCGRVTPPGESEPICCINGAVSLDGQAITGAEVQIQVASRPAAQLTMFTQPSDPLSPIPFYQASLSNPPLSAQVGDELLITARYGDHAGSLMYHVRPGSQQVNVVLPLVSASDYIVQRAMPYVLPAGTFLRPMGVAAGANGEVAVLDTWNNRVQFFGSDGRFLRQFGARGTLPGQFNQPRGIALDGAGNVYISDTRNSRIQKLSSTGTPLAVWGGPGDAPGQFGIPGGIAVDGSGNIYVVDSGNDRVQKLSSTGEPLAVWGESASDPVQFSFGDIDMDPNGIAVDSAGNIYVGNTYPEHVQKLSSTGQPLGVWTWDGAGIGGIAIDAIGNVYVDIGAGRIQKRSSAGMVLDTWSIPEGATGLAVGGDGSVYLAQWFRNRVQKLSRTGEVLATWGGEDAPALALPHDIALDRGGNLYIADMEHDRIEKRSRTGEHLATISLPRDGTHGFVGGAIAVDASGSILLADPDNAWVRKLSATGQVLATWHVPAGPDSIALDSAGAVYVLGNDQVLKLSATGQLLAAWGATGSAPGQFASPADLALDSAGNIYVLDQGNNRIQKLSSAGQPLAAWGAGGSGPGAFSYPGGIAVDASGAIYVADTGNERAVKLSSTGAFLTSWGMVRGSGPGQFRYPDSIAVDTDGTVYVADSENFNVQAFRPATAARPLATISSLSTRTLAFDATLDAYGIGQDSDATPAIRAYRWLLDGQVELGTSAALSAPASQLGPGAHTISFAVQDDEGDWSDPVGTDVQVAPPPDAQWTMLLYLDGDYDDQYALSAGFDRAIGALSQSLPNGYVRVAALVDGPDDGDTRRLLIRPGTPARVDSALVGEHDMDDPAVLAAFVRWGQANAPARHYYLALADHGQAIQGTAWDRTSDLRNDGLLNQNAYLTVKELGAALQAPDIAPISILHLDACSMNLLDVGYEVRDQVAILISSQYLGWSYFAYDAYQARMGASSTPRDVALGVTDEYARLAAADGNLFTITALDLARIEPVAAAVDFLAAELAVLAAEPGGADYRPMLDAIRQATQTFESNGDLINTSRDEYIDLVDWATRIRNSVPYPAAKARAGMVLTELTGAQPFILSNKATPSGKLPPTYANGASIDLSRAHGVSIFYPVQWETQIHTDYLNDQLFAFTAYSRWPDYLIARLGTPAGVTRQSNGPIALLSSRKQLFLPLVRR